MSVFDKDDKTLLDEEEARLNRYLNKTTSSKSPKVAPVAPQRAAVNTMKAQNAQPAPAPTSSANVPDWKRRQNEMEQHERDRQDRLERDKRDKVSTLPAADSAPEVNYISPVAPVSAIEAIRGKRPDAHCSHCGRGVGPADMFCPNCGRRCDEPIVAAAAASKPRFCTSCGTKAADPSQKFCGGCGRNIDGTSLASAAQPKDSGIGLSVFGDEQNEGAREAARLNNVVEKPGLWVQREAAKVMYTVEQPTQPDGWVITLSRIPASPDKPVLLQVGMPNPVTIFQGGDGMVSKTLTAPITKEGKITFTLEVPKLPFQIRKPFDTKQGHYLKMGLSGSDIVFSQSINPFPQ
jgi:hypothetical protein